MKHIAIIPARSGSKGLPDKNIKFLQGIPLLAHSIHAAQASGIFDVIHVSTDSEKYAEIARKYGADVPFLRSTHTSSDTASSWDAVLEVLTKYAQLGQEFDTVTLLQPTSPLRTSQDIRNAYEVMFANRAHAVVAVCEPDHSPLWCNTLPGNHCMDGFLRPEAYLPRQQIPTFYRINGALYLITTEELKHLGKLTYNEKTFAYVMPPERSVDIDNEVDFLIAEALLETLSSKQKSE